MALDDELVELRDFLVQHEPFDAMDPAVVATLPRRLGLRYSRRGSAINDPFGRKWLRYAAGTSLLFGLIHGSSFIGRPCSLRRWTLSPRPGGSGPSTAGRRRPSA